MLLKAMHYKSSKLVLLVLIFTVFLGGNVFAAEKQSSATTKLKVLFETKMKSVNTDEVRDLINAGADVDVRIKDDFTLLEVASSYNNIEVVKLLLEAGADPNKTRSTDGLTPLFMASFDNNIEVVKLLLEAGADTNKANAKSMTALFLASQNGHTDIVRLLLRAKADPNKAKTDGTTPLFLATYKGHTNIVRLLLEAKADINATIK